MKHIQNGLTCVLLMILYGFVFSDPGYLLLRETHHVALSRESVFVEYFLSGNKNNTETYNVSITLLDIGNNQTITSKDIFVDQSHGSLEFDCSHFIAAGLYQFQIIFPDENRSNVDWRSSILNVTWPQFHINLNRTSNIRSFQIGVFSNEQFCLTFPDKHPTVLLEVEHTHSFQDLEGISSDRFMLYKTYKEIPLSPSQWVEFECASVRPEAFITVSLKPMFSESLMAFMGPVDLVKTFRYKLVTLAEQKCDASVNVNVIPPPCNYADGKVVVYKEVLRGSAETSTTLAENVLQTGDKVAQFNCTLFDIGRNKYCFEFFIASGKIYSFLGAKECVGIRREIESWGLWQSWSPCSVTCGDGERERFRECLTTSSEKPACKGRPKETSLCSLEECTSISVKPSSKTTTYSKDTKTSNTVTIAGISLCLTIIIITIVITLWRKFHKTQKCSSTVKHNATHSGNGRKNSDEENIYQMRESFSDMGEGLHENVEDTVDIPLTYRQSMRVAEEKNVQENENLQPNVQKIIPPIFSYRLAQQQLKEMKQRGLTEGTKLYHVSPNPMSDTAVDGALAPPLVTDNCEDNIANKFRIQSPFIEQRNLNPQCHGERSNPLSPYQGTSPCQTLPRLSQFMNEDPKIRSVERAYHKNNNFRRTSSFHETKHNKPFRERSLSTLSPRQTMAYNPRTRTWQYPTAERAKHKSIRADKNPENLSKSASFAADPVDLSSKNLYMWPSESKHDLISSRHAAAKASMLERLEQNRVKKGSSPIEKSWNRVQDYSPTPKDSYERRSPFSPAQYRREKCQSFPRATDYSFYDNSSFRLTEAEQQMIDLPGYFASNEEDETSTLSMERLVI
ncbi:thrombospondin type-1 domain-containing protein 1 [Xenopus laevis]|uniref:Thrombospondin type-1 domain-containing protein 1 n=2 Tax=Xenopus laevis TaxID=8355 RepID=A0A974DPV6_XENLA|nr:thrombospondin type-1 domain-containing protein 1 [Xenopus laevis]OCT95984.1 hypothetical protein XELAEV_18013676mg [Xenopus laevis]